MPGKFEIIDHTADIGLIIHGDSLQEVFVNAAAGLFSLMTDMDNIKPVIKQQIELSADDMESLLIDWLNELLYLLDANGVVFGKFEILELTNNKLKAVCYGEKIDGRHEIRREIKAATYHMLNLSKEGKGYKAQVIFDL
jgi:SHS2 domain-containing protein